MLCVLFLEDNGWMGLAERKADVNSEAARNFRNGEWSLNPASGMGR
jgi:hypothetical protein